MIVRARTVVTMDGPSIDNGAVAIAGEEVVAVGAWPSVRSQGAGELVDLGECALLPG